MTQTEAEGFYAEHKERPFFNDLVAFMTSGPVSIQVLEGENAIALNRKLMGATNPKERRKVPSARILPNQLMQMLFMAPILQVLLVEKSTIFSKLKKFVLVTLKVPLSLFI